MKNEKAEDVQYFVTCAYCGTQTGLSFKQLEDFKPLKCRMCGAPFIIEVPGKPTAEGDRKHLYRQCARCGEFVWEKRLVEYNCMLYCWRCFEDMEDLRIERREGTIILISATIAVIIFICFVLLC
jgi:hypothetical protein